MNIKANLFGPFVGSISWEMYNFAPYAIHLKKENPATQMIVYTRPDRFDLYGSYADTLIPLRIKNDNKLYHNKFSLKGLDQTNYKKMIRMVNRKYQSYRDIENHFYPDISENNYEVRWQFPRDKMDYNFKPRQSNETFLSKLIGDNKIIFIDLSGFYFEESFYFLVKLNKLFDKKICFVCYNPNNVDCEILFSSRKIINLHKFNHNENTSILGCSIIAMKKAIITISMNISNISHMSLLLGKKLFLCRDYDKEFVKLINPHKTQIQSIDDLYKTPIQEFKL